MIVLSGEGNAFCAGLDLGSFGLNDDAPSDPRSPNPRAKLGAADGVGLASATGACDICVHGVCFGVGFN